MRQLSDIATLNETPSKTPILAKTGRMILRLVRASQPISRVEIAHRLGINRSTVTDALKPLIAAGLMREEQIQPISGVTRSLGRPRMGLTFSNDHEFFAGVYLGVRGTQIGLTTLSGKNLGEDEFVTPSDSREALKLMRAGLEKLCAKVPEGCLKVIGVSVPGVTDAERRKLLYSPHLGWENVAIADSLQNLACNKSSQEIRVVVENDATTSAIYESRLSFKKTTGDVLKDFILVRSGTGIGVGMVLGNEIYRGSGNTIGIAGEFGHTTIVAGGKPCLCGNRGCWEKYAAASAASALYVGDRKQLGGMKPPRFVEIVERAEAGEIRAQKTLERIGEYLGIGIGNVITGLGVPNVIISGRIVLGWKFINKPLKKAVGRSMAGKLFKWSVEPGEPRGAGLGGAFEVAVEDFLARGFSHLV